MAFTKETARRQGAKGGRAKARRKLTLERVERELLSLESPKDREPQGRGALVATAGYVGSGQHAAG